MVDSSLSRATTSSVLLRTWMMLGTLMVWLAGMPSGLAATPRIAVLDLDGYGVDFEATQMMSQGVRDGFLEEGVYDPLDGYQIGDLVSEGHVDDLREARKLLAEARLKVASGQATSALSDLARVLEIHEAANSWVARRAELADAHYFTAVALARSGRSGDALSHIVETLYLYPGYDTDRAMNPASSIQSLFKDAYQAIANQDPHAYSGAELAGVGRLLGTPNVVVGFIRGDGTVELRLYRDGQLEAELVDTVSEIPLPPGDSYYAELARRLAGSGPPATTYSSVSTASSSSTDDGFVDVPFVEFEDDLDEIEVGETSVQGAEEKPRRLSRNQRKVGKIKTTGGIRYGKPVYQRWWFWTAIGVAAVGGGVYLYHYLQEDEEPIFTVDDTYSVSADLSGL